jgi:uncharacterized protein
MLAQRSSNTFFFSEQSVSLIQSKIFAMLSSEEIIKFLKDNQPYLKQNFFVTEIGLFGSFARNEQEENSDIDFLVEFAPNTPNLYDKELDLKVFLGNHFNRKVDICSKKWIKPIFRPMVLNDVRYAY